jgi:hypothetical protein
MLAEIVSDMKSNMTFLAPLLSGVVIGLSAMITSILGKLELTSISGEVAGMGTLDSITGLFERSQMIPPYLLQIFVGIYLIEIIFILTGTLVVVDSGNDPLEKTNKAGKNLKLGIGLYFITSLISTLALSFISIIVLGNLT